MHARVPVNQSFRGMIVSQVSTVQLQQKVTPLKKTGYIIMLASGRHMSMYWFGGLISSSQGGKAIQQIAFNLYVISPFF